MGEWSFIVIKADHKQLSKVFHSLSSFGCFCWFSFFEHAISCFLFSSLLSITLWSWRKSKKHWIWAFLVKLGILRGQLRWIMPMHWSLRSFCRVLHWSWFLDRLGLLFRLQSSVASCCLIFPQRIELVLTLSWISFYTHFS